jgi:hypothetical protein
MWDRSLGEDIFYIHTNVFFLFNFQPQLHRCTNHGENDWKGNGQSVCHKFAKWYIFGGIKGSWKAISPALFFIETGPCSVLNNYAEKGNPW